LGACSSTDTFSKILDENTVLASIISPVPAIAAAWSKGVSLTSISFQGPLVAAGKFEQQTLASCAGFRVEQHGRAWACAADIGDRFGRRRKPQAIAGNQPQFNVTAATAGDG
jgi:hypothetical protein